MILREQSSYEVSIFGRKFSGAEESHPSLVAEISILDENFPMQSQKFQDYIPVR